MAAPRARQRSRARREPRMRPLRRLRRRPNNWSHAMKPMHRCNACRTRQLRLWTLLIPALLLAGCATTGRVIDPCAGWSPIVVSKADRLTDGTAKQILAHDLHGVDQGCWPAPAKAKPAP